MKTWYGRTEAEIKATFSARELRELELAEGLYPYGEYAETLRAQFLAASLLAAQGSKAAAQRAAELESQLLGPAAKKKGRRRRVDQVSG